MQMVKDSPEEDLSVSLDELLALTPAHQAPRPAAVPAEGDLTLQGQQHRKQQLEIEDTFNTPGGAKTQWSRSAKLTT